jgi:hypothetical protein
MDQQKFLGLDKLPCLELVEIDPAGKTSTVEFHFVLFPAKNVVHDEPYITDHWQLIPDYCRWVEGVRVVLL